MTSIRQFEKNTRGFVALLAFPLILVMFIVGAVLSIVGWVFLSIATAGFEPFVDAVEKEGKA